MHPSSDALALLLSLPAEARAWLAEAVKGQMGLQVYPDGTTQRCKTLIGWTPDAYARGAASLPASPLAILEAVADAYRHAGADVEGHRLDGDNIEYEASVDVWQVDDVDGNRAVLGPHALESCPYTAALRVLEAWWASRTDEETS